MLADYVAINDYEGIKLVREALTREEYNRNYIVEINKLDINERYGVYLCAYLITAVHSDADYAFLLLMAILSKLEE